MTIAAGTYSTSAATGISTATYSAAATAPSGITVGDFLLTAFRSSSSASTASVATPSGWTLIGKVEGGQNNYLFYKFATSADTTATSYTFTASGGSGTLSWAAGVQRFTGVDTTTPIDAAGATADTGYSASTTTHTMTLPSVTTVTANAWQVALVGIDDTQLSTSNMPVATGFTALVDGSSVGYKTAYRVQATPGATGTSAWTWTGSYVGASIQGVTCALRPAAAVSNILATETFTGTTGAAWPSQWTTTAGNGAAAPTIQSNTGQLNQPTVGGYVNGSGAFLSGMTATSSTDVTLDVLFSKPTDETYLNFAVGVPSVPAAGTPPSNVYGFTIYPANGSLSGGTVYIDGGGNGQNISGDVSVGAWTANVAKRIRYQCINASGTNTIKIKVWDPAGTEPSTWLASNTDTRYPSNVGKLWIGYASGYGTSTGYARLDNITVTNGQTTAGSVALAGPVATVAVAAPAGSVIAAHPANVAGPVATVTTSAPAGVVARAANVVGPVATVALAALAGTIQAAGSKYINGPVAGVVTSARAGTVTANRVIVLAGPVATVATVALAGTWPITLAAPPALVAVRAMAGEVDTFIPVQVPVTYPGRALLVGDVGTGAALLSNSGVGYAALTI